MTPIRTARRLLYTNSKWRVYADDLRGDGTAVDGYLVLVPVHSDANMVTGVAVLGETGGRFALLHNHRHPIEQRSWEIVKGFVDQGETPTDAALRELTEETGLVCTPDNLIPLGSFMPEGATMAARGLLFLARHCQPTTESAQPDGNPSGEIEIGLGSVTLFGQKTLKDMAETSEIEDAATLIGIYRTLAWLEQHHEMTLPGTCSHQEITPD